MLLYYKIMKYNNEAQLLREQLGATGEDGNSKSGEILQNSRDTLQNSTGKLRLGHG